MFLLSLFLPAGQRTCTCVTVLVRVQGGRQDSDSFFRLPEVKGQHKCQGHPDFLISQDTRKKEWPFDIIDGGSKTDLPRSSAVFPWYSA